MGSGRQLKLAAIVATGAAQKILPTELAKKAARKSFAKKLVELKGMPMKPSQILSSGDSEQAMAHREALQQVEAMSLELVSKLLQERCPALFKEIDSISEFSVSASLGQVHQVQLKDGSVMALKIQYPSMDDQMSMDEQLLGLLTHAMPHFKKGFEMEDYQKTLHAELRQELDYEREARYLNRLYQHFSAHQGIVIPEPQLDHCGSQHLAMSWEPSEFVRNFCEEASQAHKRVAMDHLVQFLLESICKAFLVHADPNPGNYGLRQRGDHVQWVIYDAGSVVDIPKEYVMAFLKITQCVALEKGDLLPLLEVIGFQRELLLPMHSQLMAFFQVLLEPFLSVGRFDLSDWRRKERCNDILGDQRWNFMTAAPASFLLPMRFIQGFLSYAEQLNVGVYIRPHLEKLWSLYESELEGLEDLIYTKESVIEHSSMAKILSIVVRQHGKLKVQLSLPRASIEDLSELMDDGVKEKLREQNISIDDIVKQARQRGYRPMVCFELHQDDDKYVRVELK